MDYENKAFNSNLKDKKIPVYILINIIFSKEENKEIKITEQLQAKYLGENNEKDNLFYLNLIEILNLIKLQNIE